MRMNLRERRTEAGWAELWEKPYRAVCEHILKIASWSVLLAAVRYLADKSGDWKLAALNALLTAALLGYIFSLVVNLQIELFPPEETWTKKRRWITIVANLVVSLGILAFLHFISNTIVTAFAALQAQR
jgi:L-cystine uptake protein TcyP (sodium:dicarboxylate symporter family)